MLDPRKLLPALLLLTTAFPGAVYDRVFEAFNKVEHRLPGSPEFETCAKTLEETLQGAGLTVHRQRYHAIVPVTKHCRFTANGVAISGLVPLAPNGVAQPTTCGETLTGPILYLGDGGPEQTTNRSVAGAIALIDWGTPHGSRLFSLGAKAVIFVGVEAPNPWNIQEYFSGYPLMLVRGFLPRAEAERQGLLGGEAKTGSLEIATAWQDVTGVNLWVLLPGAKGKHFALGREELIVLSSDISTVGTVPGLVPDSKAAANTALLAETTVNLAGMKRDRGVLTVFFGDHYAMFNGARQFYYAYYKALPHPDNKDPFPVRASMYRTDLEETKAKLRLLGEADYMASSSPMRRDVDMLMRRRLDIKVNDLNFALRGLVLQGMKTPSATQSNDERALKAEKSGWNGLREDLREKRATPERAAFFSALVAETRGELESYAGYLQDRLRDTGDCMELAAAITNRVITHHFEFSFAAADQPWYFLRAWGHRFNRWQLQAIGNWSRSLSALQTVWNRVKDPSWPAPLITDDNAARVRPIDLAGCDAGSASVAHSVNVYGYLLGSIGVDSGDQLPGRRPIRLDALVPELTGYLGAILADPALSLRCTVDRSKFNDNLVYKYENGIYKGMRFDNYAKSSSVLEGPSVGALVFQAPNVLKQERSLKHVGGLARINAQGYYLMPLIIQNDYIPIAAAMDSNGMIIRMPEGFHYQIEKRLFFCYGNGFFTPYIPMQENSVIYRPALLNGANDSGFPRAIGSTRLGEFSLNYYDRDTTWKYLVGGLRLLGSSAENPGGEGFGYDRFSLASFDTIRTSLHDYFVLNESRLQALRERNIYNNSLELMHADTGAMIEEAMRAETNAIPNPTLARAHRTLALALAEHVYTPLRGIIDDMVKAVVILLLLTIPFAFAMERLVFNFTLITRQITGFAAFFLGTFGVLYFVHPAFRLASTPMVIFLAFVIILLSGIVVYLIMNKFRDEVKSMQGMGSTVHSREAHRATAMAAVLIGVSGMRNRPLKTGLTAVTVVLLTFTILVFASFTSKMGVRTTYRDRGAGVENRIEIHKHTLLAIEKEVRESLATLYGDRYHFYMRSGVFYDITKNLWNQVNFERDLVLRNPLSDRLVQIEAIVGLMPGEVEKVASLRALLPGFGAEKTPFPPLYLSKACARDLSVREGETVMFQHKRFTFAGFFDSSRLQMAENLDGSKVLPPNYKKTVQQNALNAAGDNAMDSALNNLDNNSFAWATADLTAIAPYDSLLDVEHAVNFIALLPKSPAENVARTAERIARAFNYPVYAKDDAGIFQYFYTKTYSGSGMRDILIPLIIGGLIIFSSLLGSIVDREREIFTFSALGLSPPNVAALFFAESGVYAVIGGVGGYLVSQVVVKFLTLLASFGFMTAPEMNFSSFSSVFTILIVMTTIILSTIYPAVKAGRSANPGVNRSWKMPAPKNGRLSFKFPFTVSTLDFAGIISFLHEHFDNHADVAVGEFTVRDFQLTNKVVNGGKLERADIEAEVSLAPFDLGISQHFRLSVVPTDLAGIDEVQVDLEKHSGTTTSWVRANRDFIDDLRNQFLIWRSLPAESVAKYRTQTESLA